MSSMGQSATPIAVTATEELAPIADASGQEPIPGGEHQGRAAGPQQAAVSGSRAAGYGINSGHPKLNREVLIRSEIRTRYRGWVR
jgi:hypothetical protein